jgi:hypothetical protein
MACSPCSRRCNAFGQVMRVKEVGCGGAFRGSRAPRSELTATALAPGWEMFPVGSRSAAVRTLCAMVERTAAMTGSACGDDGDWGVVAGGKGDAAAS